MCKQKRQIVVCNTLQDHLPTELTPRQLIETDPTQKQRVANHSADYGIGGA